jgi:two-component system sensor kinase FixL
MECKVVDNIHTGNQQLLIFVTDVSTRKLADDSLHQQRIKIASIDRLRSLNELVHGIAQDQNRLLTMMNNYLYGCIQRLERGDFGRDELAQTLKKVVNQSRELAEIITNRKSIISKGTLRYEYSNLSVIIHQTISLITHEMIDFPIIIQYEAAAHYSKVKIDKFHIQQTILSLSRNAIEAMRDCNILEPKLLIETAHVSPNMIEVAFFDNGPGFDQDLISKLFEPHFTTKSYGIGLGLTVSRAIIEKHGGQLFALSNPSGGACVGFTLPMSVS